MRLGSPPTIVLKLVPRSRSRSTKASDGLGWGSAQSPAQESIPSVLELSSGESLALTERWLVVEVQQT